MTWYSSRLHGHVLPAASRRDVLRHSERDPPTNFWKGNSSLIFPVQGLSMKQNCILVQLIINQSKLSISPSSRRAWCSQCEGCEWNQAWCVLFSFRVNFLHL